MWRRVCVCVWCGVVFRDATSDGLSLRLCLRAACMRHAYEVYITTKSRRACVLYVCVCVAHDYRNNTADLPSPLLDGKTAVRHRRRRLSGEIQSSSESSFTATGWPAGCLDERQRVAFQDEHALLRLSTDTWARTSATGQTKSCQDVDCPHHGLVGRGHPFLVAVRDDVPSHGHRH